MANYYLIGYFSRIYEIVGTYLGIELVSLMIKCLISVITLQLFHGGQLLPYLILRSDIQSIIGKNEIEDCGVRRSYNYRGSSVLCINNLRIIPESFLSR